MADDQQKLLRYIVENLVVSEADMEAQRDATAVQDLPAEVDAIRGDAQRDSNRLAPFFGMGLREAADTTGPFIVDDTTAEGNSIADAFARYLVSTGLATSESTPLPDGHFRYSFAVNWPRLRDVAKQADVDLQELIDSRD
jgi:hypothetical protein